MSSSPARLWWHLHPLSFLGAEPDALPADAPVVHRLPRLQRWLGHAAELGADGLLLGPIFASSSHGYDTVDYDRVDPRLGDTDDLVALVAAARDAGMAVALDGVFNHVGRGFGPFTDVLRDGPSSPYAPWFRLRWPDGDWAGPGTEPDYDSFEGHGGLVALDHSEPGVRDMLSGVLDRYAEAGITAWRLDAAYAVDPEALAALTARARERRPDSWFLGEVIHGDYAATAAAAGLDAVTQYELWKALWSGLNDRNLYELAHALGRHQEFAQSTTPQTFVGNHDVTRIASRLDDERHLDHAVVVLFTVAGVPSVYAGDEHGLHGLKEERIGGDDAIRPAFGEDPLALDAEVPGMFQRYREMAALRREHPWLEHASTEVQALANEHMSYLSSGPDGEELLVVLSVSDDDVVLDAPGGGWRCDRGTAVVGGEPDGSAQVTVGPHGWAVLVRD